MFKVRMSACAVVFASGANTQWIAESRQVVCKRAGIERVSASLRPTAKGVTEIFIRIRLNQMLGQGIGLGEKYPVIYAQRELPIHLRPVVVGRQDVEYSQPRQPRRMVESQAVGNPRAPVVTGQR